MKILILSLYYRPDLSAGSFRATALVESLQQAMPSGSHIDVITSLPNRYQSFTAEAPEREELADVSILRIPLPVHRNGMWDQSVAYIRFSRAVLGSVRGTRYDIVFATSSRLMTAVLGARVANITHARLYLDIRDIFVDTMKDVLPRRFGRLLLPSLTLLEKYVMRRADHVNLVSPGFSEYFKSRYPKQHFSCLTNAVDDEFLAAAPRVVTPAARAGRPIMVVYAGNIGEGQGLDAIVPEIARRMGNRICFRIIGDGGRRDALLDALAATGVTNVEVLPPVSRAELIAEYRDADVLFLHLNAYSAFEKVLPSKIFEYAAMGKPIWAGVAGYAGEFVRSEIDNACVFAPCDVDAAVSGFDTLSIRTAPREAFLARYSRSTISADLAHEVLATAATQ